MLFRIEDSENEGGVHREYKIPLNDLPIIPISQIRYYIVNEVRKEINGAKDRCLLSYSKSLGTCLLKYNKYADNEIHINYVNNEEFVIYYDLKENKYINYVPGMLLENKDYDVRLYNFMLDVSNNDSIDRCLKKFTGVGRKKIASPEKDKEVILFQSPNDLIIKQYSNSIYLLYSLVIKYGMEEWMRHELIGYVSNLEA